LTALQEKQLNETFVIDEEEFLRMLTYPDRIYMVDADATADDIFWCLLKSIAWVMSALPSLSRLRILV
jgi:hypothetical protein